MERLSQGETLGLAREETVVCIPVFGGLEQFAACVRSVLEHTPLEVPLLVCDDGTPGEAIEGFLRGLGPAELRGRRLAYFRHAVNVGFPANANQAFALASPGDVVLLNSDCEVAEGWLEGLLETAASDSRVATVTALTNHGSLVSVPERGVPSPALPEGWPFSEAAAAVRSASLRLRPSLPTAVGHCVLVRRPALELVGEFDLAFSPGYGEEVDFSQRCLQAGLTHLLADDVLVFHHGGGTFSPHGAPSPVQIEHETILAARYPYYHAAIRKADDDPVGPLARALGVARRALTGLDVTVDARILAQALTGTQLHVLELIAALARSGRAQVSAIVPDQLSPDVEEALARLPAVQLLTRTEAEARRSRADVVHRPFQINTEEDLSFLASIGERLVVTHQDLISFHNPAYFADFDAWEGYRRITRAAMAFADRVVFFSAHARADAVAADLVEPSRTSVVRIGVDHTVLGPATSPRAPAAVTDLPAHAETILCIGTDFHHKNRLFALRVLEQLQRRHGWEGWLLLAGPRVAQGSSHAEEAAWRQQHPAASAAALELGSVTEAEKAWLYRRAGAVIYPSVHEGFGLVPFEAADHGVPCLWAGGTSLSELLPDEAAMLVGWDAERSADRALALLRDQTSRVANLEAIGQAAAALSWDATARDLISLYQQACADAATPAGALERRHGMMAGALGEDAMRLVGPGGALPEDMQRPLLALATHRQFAAPAFKVLRAGYRLSYRLRRLREPSDRRDGDRAS